MEKSQKIDKFCSIKDERERALKVAFTLAKGIIDDDTDS